MCLAIPGKIEQISGHQVTVRYPNDTRKVLVGDDPVKVGDYVLVQMGVVVGIISKKEADVSLKAWSKIS
jgi:hydrogenase assembly chaperone HypC/HupF